MKQYDIVIIGAGIAGMTAAIYASRAGKSVLVLEEKAHGGQIISALKIDNWPGDYGVSGADLTEKIYHQVNNLGVPLAYESVESVKKSQDGFTVQTDETTYLAKAIIIAVGTNPRKLSSKQTADAGNRPISYCATCDGALYQNQPVVVIGSGNTAKHEMKYLSGIASKVYHIHHDDPIPKDAKAIFVAIGRVPATKIFQDLIELDKSGYIVAGEDCHTSCKGVYVAGDCRTKHVRQLVTAAADGAVAASEAVQYLG